MTSKLVVNTIEADTGISSVSFASSISLSSTSKFHFGNSGIDIGADTNINRPATGVIGFNINSGEKVRINSNGFIGINTSSPLAPLHTYNDTNNTIARLESGDATCRLQLVDSAGMGFVAVSGDNLILANTSSITERLRIQSDGNVGIATDLSGGGGAYGRLSVVIPSQSGGSALQVMNSAVGSGDGSLTNIVLRSVNNLGTQWAGAEYMAHEHIFKNQGTEALRIISTGKVGIGVTNPDSKLEVRDGASTGIIVRCTSTQSTDSNKALRVRNNSDTNTFSVSHKGQGYFAGKVGINETNPDSDLEINRGSEGKYMTVGGDDASNGRGLSFTSSEGGTGSNGALHTINAKSGNGAIALATAGTERFRIDSDGNVTKPTNAMFKVMRNSNQSIGSNGWHTIQFHNDSTNGMFDIGGNFNTGNHRFTAPVTGYYQFGLNQRIDGGDSDYFRVAFSVNGDVGASNNYPYGHAIYRDSDGFNYYSFSITSLIYLTSGQYVRAEAYSHSDTTWYLQDESIFYGYLVG